MVLTMTADVGDLLTHPGAGEGERNATCARLVGNHARLDPSEASEADVEALLSAWAERCNPPLKEWRRHLRGVYAKERAKRDKEERRGQNVGEGGRKELIPANVGEGDGELIPSFPNAGVGEGQAKGGINSFLPDAHADAWPTLHADALHGLFGEMLTAVSPKTEADPANVLLGWLTCFGSIVGRGAWVEVGARLHHPALYVGIVGRTSDAKGDGWAAALWPFREVEPTWAGQCIANGVGSGEGLVERVADKQMVLDKKSGEAKVIPGAMDKRCLLRLSELSRCFKVGRRENATLSEYLREGWDGEPIHVPNRKGNALSTSGYVFSMMGDITPGMVRKLLDSGTEAFDGYANRFLWAAVKRSRFLPSGGTMAVLKPYLKRLASALAFAKGVGELKRDAEAERLWESVYPSLATSGDSVPHTDRAKPYAVRLSMLYALADSSAVIRADHLRAALALWDYCRASARHLFGAGEGETKIEGHGVESLAARLLEAITNAPGIMRSELLRAFRTATADALGAALAWLRENGLAHPRQCKGEGAGRPSECWYPGPEPTPRDEGDGESDGKEGINSALAEADASASADGKEGINSAEALALAPAGGINSFLPMPLAVADAPANADAKAGGINSFLPPHANADAQAQASEPEPPTPTPLFVSPLAQADATANALPDAYAVAYGPANASDAQRPALTFRERQHAEWHARYLKAQAERVEQERARMQADAPLTPADAAFLAEVEAMERACEALNAPFSAPFRLENAPFDA